MAATQLAAGAGGSLDSLSPPLSSSPFSYEGRRRRLYTALGLDEMNGLPPLSLSAATGGGAAVRRRDLIIHTVVSVASI